MSFYFVKPPFFLRWIYPKATWNKKTVEKVIYLTFDDGPSETITPFVLDVLKKHNAKATFFCLGGKVITNSTLFSRIGKEGHSIGNHSYSHLNGLKTKDNVYIRDIEKADTIINSKIIRPPYGKIKISQYLKLSKKYRIIMWDVLSGDFDKNIDDNRCYKNVVGNTKNGSIIVFHDNEHSADKLKIVLPKILRHYSDLGYRFDIIK